MESGRYDYWKSCVDFCGRTGIEALQEMISDSIEITRRTFMKHVNTDTVASMAQSMGYEADGRKGLSLAADWHVCYFRSKFKGKRVYYMRHSSIEYIFTLQGDEN